MSCRSDWARAAASLAAVAMSFDALGALYDFRFSGVIVLVENTPLPPFDVVNVGDAWTYRLWIDTTTPASDIPGFYGVAAGTNYRAIVRGGATVGSVEIPFGPLPMYYRGSVFVSNDTLGMDVFGMFAFIPGVIQLGVVSFDAQMLALDDENIPTTLSPEWDPEQTAFVINYGDTLTASTARVLGVVQEASVRLVPTPGGAALFAAAGVLMGGRPRRAGERR